ncbi:TolC family protein [bacterium]|nr:TolC family protein [bacterium]
MNKLFFAFTSIIIALQVMSFAQEAQNIPSTMLTLARAESIAFELNPDILSSSSQYRKASAEYLSAWSNFLPNASVSGDWRRSNRESMYIVNDQFLSSRDRYSLGFSASFPLFSGGQDILYLKQAKFAKDIAKLSLDDAISETRYDIYSAYFALVQATMQYGISKQSLSRILDEQKITVQRRELGSASDVDVSKMRVQVAQKKLSEIQAKNAVDRSREQLCSLLNFPLDTTFVIDTTSTPPPANEIIPLDNFLSQYKSNRVYRQSKISLRSSKLSYVSSYLNYLPRVNFSSSWGWSGIDMPDRFSTLSDEGSSSYGLSLSWTLFSGTSRIASILSSSAQLDAAKYSLEKADISVQQQIREAYRKMVEASASFELSQAQVNDARLAHTAMKKRFELGSATLLEFLDAELTLEQAQFQRVSAIADFYTQSAQIEWLVGK